MIRRAWQVPAVLGPLLVAGCGGGDGGTEPPPPIDWDAIDPIVYSQHVQPIFQASCNAAECHNASDRALGLSLASYSDVAAGSRFAVAVLPYEPGQSHLIQHLTGELEPRMPVGLDPLDPEIIDFLRRWISVGAPDDAGTPMYSEITSKAFVACQAENEVAVLDMDTGRRIRAVHVEAPHSVMTDGRLLYVSRFETASDNIHVYDADTLELIRTGRAGTFPALMRLTPDGSQLWVTNFDTFGSDNKVYVLDPVTLELIRSFQVPNQIQPHGLDVSADGTSVYVTNILSDNVSIYCTGIPTDCGLDPGPDFVGLVKLPTPPVGTTHQPQQCVLSPDDSRLFVSALGSDRVYVMNTATQTFVDSLGVEVGDGPWHLDLSASGDELWVANWLGESVSVLDVTNPDAPVVVETLQPTHPFAPGTFVVQRPIGVSFFGEKVWVACANDDNENSGHHPPPGGEKNPGNVVVFDRATRGVLSVTEVPNFARFVAFAP